MYVMHQRHDSCMSYTRDMIHVCHTHTHTLPHTHIHVCMCMNIYVYRCSHLERGSREGGEAERGNRCALACYMRHDSCMSYIVSSEANVAPLPVVCIYVRFLYVYICWISVCVYTALVHACAHICIYIFISVYVCVPFNIEPRGRWGRVAPRLHCALASLNFIYTYMICRYVYHKHLSYAYMHTHPHAHHTHNHTHTHTHTHTHPHIYIYIHIHKCDICV